MKFRNNNPDGANLGVDCHIKIGRSWTFVVSLMGANQGLWSHLGSFSFRDQVKLETRPDWSNLKVLFTFPHKHSQLFIWERPSLLRQHPLIFATSGLTLLFKQWLLILNYLSLHFPSVTDHHAAVLVLFFNYHDVCSFSNIRSTDIRNYRWQLELDFYTAVWSISGKCER